MIKHRNKQTGGTVLGLIIGLIIGLGVALVVAVTIKNTPLPFVEKVGKPDRASSNSQIADPNKSLYGNREPAKEASKQFVKKAEEKPISGEIQQIGNLPLESPPAQPLEAKPLEVKATIKPSGEEKTVAAQAEEKFTYFLQAGAFLEQADAENTKAKLALLGFSANIVERQSDNGTLYRVRIGPFGQQETMTRMRSKLSDNGVDAAVVRIPK